MLIFAIGVVLAAYAATGLGLNGRLPAGIAGYGLAFAALMLAAHFAVRRLGPVGRSAAAAAGRPAERPGHRDDLPAAAVR